MTTPTGNTDSNDITVLLQAAQSGNNAAVNELIPFIYETLRKMAHKQMQAERSNHTLQPTALVHEAYLKLVAQSAQSFENRLHFFSIAARQMRRILIDHARARVAAKRGGSCVQVDDFDVADARSVEGSADLIELNQAIETLAALSEKQARLVELKFFAGCTNEEIAELLDVSLATVKREWALARAWLKREITSQ